MIIDAHCHAGIGDGLTGPWDTSAPLDKYLRRAVKAGIQRTVLFTAFHSDYAIANRDVGTHCGKQAGSVLRLCIRPCREGSRPDDGPGAAGGRGIWVCWN